MMAMSKSTVAGFAYHCSDRKGPLKKIVAEIIQDQEAKKRLRFSTIFYDFERNSSVRGNPSWASGPGCSIKLQSSWYRPGHLVARLRCRRPRFEYITGFVILLNMITIGAMDAKKT